MKRVFDLRRGLIFTSRPFSICNRFGFSTDTGFLSGSFPRRYVMTRRDSRLHCCELRIGIELYLL